MDAENVMALLLWCWLVLRPNFQCCPGELAGTSDLAGVLCVFNIAVFVFGSAPYTCLFKWSRAEAAQTETHVPLKFFNFQSSTARSAWP